MVEPEDTTLRWFGPVRPPHHSLRGRVPTPTGERCRVCGIFFVASDQGWTLPHVAGREVTAEPYHHACLHQALGLSEPLT